MLIGLSRGFVFLSTLKTASTSIERVLRPHAEVCLLESQFGKHMTVRQMMENLGWLFVEKDIAQFFIFGVMRDPVEFVLSIYNSHKHPDFRDRPGLFTGSMDFDAFLDRWVATNPEHIVPQHSRFLDAQGRIGANYVIRFDRLNEGLGDVADILGLPRPGRLPVLNRSIGALSPAQLSPSQRRWIADRFAGDLHFMARHCGRLMDSFSAVP